MIMPSNMKSICFIKTKIFKESVRITVRSNNKRHLTHTDCARASRICSLRVRVYLTFRLQPRLPIASLCLGKWRRNLASHNCNPCAIWEAHIRKDAPPIRSRASHFHTPPYLRICASRLHALPLLTPFLHNHISHLVNSPELYINLA